MELSVQTKSRFGWVDVTDEVANAISHECRAVIIYSPHTTAGVTINENADPDVPQDFFEKLRRVFPKDESFYQHGEGNSDSHILTSLVGNSVIVPVVHGKMQLGTWQAIYLCEFDGPRRRKLILREL
jgi:secondary thiamine-phosphate synthase enzyme